MTYQEAISHEINLLPEKLLPEVLDFILFLKVKTQAGDDQLSEKIRNLLFQQELETLSQAYRKRLSHEGKLDQSADEVMAGLKRSREEIAANEYRQ